MMEIEEFLKKMTNAQNCILEFIDDDSIENNDDKLYQILDKLKINQNKNEFKSFLHLIAKISENHQRACLIFPKIQNILLYCKNDMVRYFSNNEIFSKFKNNKRCILFMLQEKIISTNRFILSNFHKKENKNYLAYCYQEIQDFHFTPNKNAYKIKFEAFTILSDQKRKTGEDDREILELIRKDSLDDFISYSNLHKIDFSAKIKPSIYETNSFLIKKGFNLIEYAAFSGSVKIFKYLYSIKAKFDQSIWQYAVHSRNSEIIHLIENFDFSKEKIDFNAAYIESIKCFYKEISNYLEENYSQYINIDYKQILKSYNFEYISKNFFNEQDILYELCHNDYITIVEILLKTTDNIFQNQSNKNPLIISIKKGNIEIMELLLQRKDADINTKHLLTKAIRSENEELVQLLLSHNNIKINSYQSFVIGDQYTIKQPNIFTAIELGNLEIVKMMLNYNKIDINAVSIKEKSGHFREKKTALYLAVELGNIEIINLLLANKKINVNKPLIIEHIDIETRDEISKREKKTVLDLAIEKNSKEIVNILLKSGKFDVNSESTVDLFHQSYVKESIAPFIMNSWVYPFLKYFVKNGYLTFFIYNVIVYIYIVTILLGLIQFQFIYF